MGSCIFILYCSKGLNLCLFKKLISYMEASAHLKLNNLTSLLIEPKNHHGLCYECSSNSKIQINRLLLEDDSASKNNSLEDQSINKEFRVFLSDNKDVLDETTTITLLERLVFFTSKNEYTDGDDTDIEINGPNRTNEIVKVKEFVAKAITLPGEEKNNGHDGVVVHVVRTSIKKQLKVN
ncbi:hypothetical protein JHK87_001163 [Glycine soja]|nr:hypothetical protein JHK87_001163 [Glycine soja]